MAETKEERRARIEKEVAARSAERTRLYLENKAKAEAAAAAKAPQLPASDAYNYSYAFRSDVGSKSTDVSGSLNLVKTPNAYYDASTNTIVDPATGERTPAVQSMWSGPTSFQGSSSGATSQPVVLTPEQIAAKENAAKLAAQYGLSIDPKTGMIIKPPANYVIDPKTGKFVDPKTLSQSVSQGGYTFTNGVLQFNGKPFTGSYNGKNYVNGVESSVVVDGSQDVGGSNAELLAIIASLQNTIANLGAKSTTDAAAAKAAEDLKERQSAFDLLYSEMDAIGLGALVEPLRGMIQRNVSPSEFAVELRQSEAYKMRFIANDSRVKKGLRVLSPREYLAVEDAYRQVLRTYGLKQFDNDAYVRQFIENDISAAELSDRVSMAVQRVQNADPAISRTLRDYYGIGQADLVAYVLDPNQQLQKIQRQVAAAEIGTAARVQGIEAGVGVAEQLAAQGITQAQAQKGYATIADILPTAEKLSQIYGATMEGYDISQAEQEVFNQLASAQRRRERLTQREIAAFSGTSGLGRTSLAGETRGQF